MKIKPHFWLKMSKKPQKQLKCICAPGVSTLAYDRFAWRLPPILTEQKPVIDTSVRHEEPAGEPKVQPQRPEGWQRNSSPKLLLLLEKRPDRVQLRVEVEVEVEVSYVSEAT